MMKPLFTIHAGEYLVGSYLEQRFKQVRLWVPTRDTGIDLLVSDRLNRRGVSLQVKFSRDFLPTHLGPAFQKDLRACGWWTINRAKLRTSLADYWVFVLQGFSNRSVDYVVIPRRELWTRLRTIQRGARVIQTYLWVTESDRCWETRGLKRCDQLLIAQGRFEDKQRNLTTWLNNWKPIADLNRACRPT
jgi:hypothetical protein